MELNDINDITEIKIKKDRKQQQMVQPVHVVDFKLITYVILSIVVYIYIFLLVENNTILIDPFIFIFTPNVRFFPYVSCKSRNK